MRNPELYSAIDKIIEQYDDSLSIEDLAEIVATMLNREYNSKNRMEFCDILKPMLDAPVDMTERFNQLINHNKNIL